MRVIITMPLILQKLLKIMRVLALNSVKSLKMIPHEFTQVGTYLQLISNGIYALNVYQESHSLEENRCILAKKNKRKTRLQKGLPNSLSHT